MASKTEAVNFRKIFASELFGLALKQSVGSNVESIYVEKLGGSLSKDDIHKILVEGAIEVSVMEALIDEQKKRIASGKVWALQAMLIACTAIGRLRLVQEFEWKLKEGTEEGMWILPRDH
ncbi:hypothetical protein JHK85_017752 [Glycine max]|nr:hypothetical protein JHK85_017752 [Glycine max]KAG5036524.1 hypothetical protein JHK86_017364 [Glycine max]